MTHQYQTLTAGGDINPCRFVKAGSASLTVLQAVLGDVCVGFAREFVYDVPTDGASLLAASSGRPIQVTRFGQLGELEAGVAIAAWDYLKPDANGRAIVALPGESFYARAVEAQATVGNRFEAEALVGTVPVLNGAQAKTADYVVVAKTDNNATFTNTGAAGAINITLPAALAAQKLRFTVRLGAAQQVTVRVSGTDTMALPTTGVQGAAGKGIRASAATSAVVLESNVDGQWSVLGFTPTWIVEP